MRQCYPSSRVSTLSLLFAVSTVVAGEVRYRVRAIPRLSLSTQNVQPTDTNNDGVVVGIDDRGTNSYFAFRWDPRSNAIEDLGSLTGCESQGAIVESVNDLGHAAGVDNADSCEAEAWLWTPAAGMVGIGRQYGPGSYSVAFDINVLNQIVGHDDTGSSIEAFLWTPEVGFQALGVLPGATNSHADGINDSTWVVGDCDSIGEAFLWRPGIGMMPLGGPDGVAGPNVYGRANDINDVGQVTGDAYFDGGLQPYLWDPIRGAVPAGRIYSEYPTGFGVGLGINNHGQIVGFEFVPGLEFPIIWDERRGLRDLRTLLNPCFSGSGADAVFYRASAINDDGWIAVSRATGARGAVLIPYIPGDLDPIAGSTTVGDGDVDLQDLANMLSNFGRAGDANYAAGDLDCDQDVDLEDLTILLSNFGETLP